MKIYDIFISYKRKSLPIASLLHYRLKILGYSVFHDIEEMHSGEFDTQLYNYIDNAKDIIVIIENDSLTTWRIIDDKGIRNEKYVDDWFYKEVSYALTKKKNLIPLWINCGVYDPLLLPEDVSIITKLHSPHFSLYHVDSSIDLLCTKGFITAIPNQIVRGISVFKLYSNKNCSVYNGKNFIGTLEAYSEEPLYWFVERKGEFRIRCVSDDNQTLIFTYSIATDEEKIIDISFKNGLLSRTNVKYGLYILIFIFNISFLYFLYYRKSSDTSGVGLIKGSSSEYVNLNTKSIDNIENKYEFIQKDIIDDTPSIL